MLNENNSKGHHSPHLFINEWSNHKVNIAESVKGIIYSSPHPVGKPRATPKREAPRGENMKDTQKDAAAHPSGIEGVKALVAAEQARGMAKADTLLERGKAHTYRAEDARGTVTSNPAQVRRIVTDNEKGTVRLYFSGEMVAAHFSRALGLTAEQFKTLWAEYKGTPAYPFFSAVVLDHTPKEALLTALKQKVTA
jgi:hypothetical protein